MCHSFLRGTRNRLLIVMSPVHTTVEAMPKPAEPATRSNHVRRWLRFSLRTPLLCFAGVAIVSAIVSALIRSANEQREAVRAVQGMNGSARYRDDSGTVPTAIGRWARQVLGKDFIDPVTAIDFRYAHTKVWTKEEFRKFGPNATADQMSRWEPWTRENVLTLKLYLENLRRLESLSFDGTVIPRHALAAVSELRNLGYLNLHKTQITSIDLRYLSDLESLEILNLRRTRIRDDGLAHLKDLTQLDSLNLGSTAIGDEGVKHLAELSRLRTLNLENTNVTDVGIGYLRSLSQLRFLHLGLTETSDESIDHLTHLVQLETLIVGDRVTKDGMALLKRSLPTCDIRWGSLRGPQP